MMMKALVYYGERDVRLEEIEKRMPEPNEVLIKVKACGVCGTDMHIFEGAQGAAPTPPKTVLGHEFAGVVEAVGKDVTSVKEGDYVCVDPNDMCGECYYCVQGNAHFCENMIGIGTTVNGGFAEYCTVAAKQVYKISEKLPFEEWAMAEPIACCLHGMDLTGVKTGQTVMIIGGGTIGLIMLQLARNSGASTLILVEPISEKRKMARSLGADITIDPLTQSVEDVLNSYSIKSVDAVIECVGRKQTMLDAISYVGKGGTAMLFGLTEPACQIPLLPFDVFKKEITIKASFINPYTQKRAISLLDSKRIVVKDLITDIIKLEEAEDIFKTDKYKGRGKIVVVP
jgi:L-iditol 2-dehydrogenase